MCCVRTYLRTSVCISLLTLGILNCRPSLVIPFLFVSGAAPVGVQATEFFKDVQTESAPMTRSIQVYASNMGKAMS